MVGGKENALTPAPGATLQLRLSRPSVYLASKQPGEVVPLASYARGCETARPCSPRGSGGAVSSHPLCPRSWVVSCQRACSLVLSDAGPPGTKGAPGNQNRVSGEHLLCARRSGLSPPAVKMYYCRHVKGGNRLREVTLLVPS